MEFRRGFAIALAVSLGILAANATQNRDDIESVQKSYSSKSKAPTLSSDSASFTNSDSRVSLTSAPQSPVESIFSEKRRKTRGIPAPGSPPMPESESVAIDESLRRETRDATDDGESNETTPLPLENSTGPGFDDTEVPREKIDDENSRGTEENPAATVSSVEDTKNSMADGASLEAAITEAAGNLNDAEQTSDSMPSTSEENQNDIEVDSGETTTARATRGDRFENENGDSTTVNDDDPTVMSSTVSDDEDVVQSTGSTGNSENLENSTEAEESTDLPATENSTAEGSTEGTTEYESDMSSVEGTDATEGQTEMPTDSTDTTESMDTTTEIIFSSEATITTTTDSVEKPQKKYNYVVYDEESGVPCTLANMSISLKVSYKTEHNRIVSSEFPVPDSAVASGACGKKQSDLTLGWPSHSSMNFDNPGENRITFQIMNDGAFFYVSNVKVNITLDSEDYANAAEATLAGASTTDLRLFSAPLKSGYHVCPTTTEIPCGQILMKIKDVSLVAYNDRKDHSGREQDVCQPSKTLSIAAIIGALVAIAVTVGIVSSYIWYRKRANTFRSELP